MLMLKPLRSFARRFLSDCCYSLGTLITTSWKRPERMKHEDLSVHMLLSSRTWHAGLLSLISFEFFTERRWNLFIHDDGSVDAQARHRIESVLPGVRFVPRSEAEVRVREALIDYPLCWKHRSNHNLFLKFFDVPLFAPNNRFIFLDSDVLFFQQPKESCCSF